MTPPKPPRKSVTMKPTITLSTDVPQSANEDPEASRPAVTDESQSEVRVMPVPRPRSKIKPKSETTNTEDSEDKPEDKPNNTHYTAIPLLRKYLADLDHSQSRPPPRPSSFKQPTASVDGVHRYSSSLPEQTAKPPAVSIERKRSTPPPRPPLPSIYYDRFPAAPKPEKSPDETQQSNSSMQQTPASPATSEEGMILCGTNGETTAAGTHSPEIKPRLSPSPLPTSEWDTLPSQSRPPPPPFTPPPVPSGENPLEVVYSEIDRPYLDVLPEENDRMSLGRSTISSTHSYQIGCYSSLPQTETETDDIDGMLRWLKKVSKSDFMAPSLYGLSIEEEIRSFTERGLSVKKAVRLFNLLMMKRNDTLLHLIADFCYISTSLDKMQKKTKTVDIAGGTTGAVGGVTAVLGIALAPATFGTSLIATVVGAGMVASAGGLSAHHAKANKKVVTRMRVEKLLYEYRKHVVDLEHCLDFILSGMNELRRHDIPRLQRAGVDRDSLKMANLSQSVYRVYTNNGRMASVSHTSGMSSEKLIQAFEKEMDQYFSVKNEQKLRKSTKSTFSSRIRLLATNLQEELDHLNLLWEMFS